MLYFSSTGFLVNDDRDSSPKWTLPSPTGVFLDLNICSPAMSWPYFNTAGGIFDFPVPTSPSGSNTTVSSNRSLFDPFDDFEYPTPYMDYETSAGWHGSSTLQGRSPSLVNVYHNTGDAPASPSLSWDAIDVNSNISAIKLIQRVTTAEDVEVAVSAISTWAKGLSWPVKEAQLLPFRLAAARLFSDAWDPARGKLFLNFDENDVFVLKRYLPLTHMDSDQTQRLFNSARGSVVAILYGKLLEAKILTSADVVVACEMLLEHHNMDGYMLGLWLLLSFAGDKVCRKPTLRRMLAIQQELVKAKRNSSFYEVEHYADRIIQLIEDFAMVQAKKTKDALPRGKRRRRGKARATEGQRRATKTCSSAGVF